MITPFSKYQRIEDIVPLLNDRESIIVPLCDNTVFVMEKALDPLEDDFITFNANDATVVGLFTKMYKMTEAISSAFWNNRLELISSYSRLLYEAYIKMRYLMKNGEEAQRIFRLSSYKGRLEIYKEHQANPNPVSAVMAKKFLSDIEEDGFTIEDIEAAPKKAFDGKNVRQLVEDIGEGSLYNTQYKMTSDSVHSDWGEIRQLYMYIKDERYAAKLDAEPLHFRVIIPNLYMSLTATEEYIQWVGESEVTIFSSLKSLAQELKRVLALIERHVLSVYDNTPEIYMTI